MSTPAFMFSAGVAVFGFCSLVALVLGNAASIADEHMRSQVPDCVKGEWTVEHWDGERESDVLAAECYQWLRNYGQVRDA